jgi:hypothetical protein
VVLDKHEIFLPEYGEKAAKKRIVPGCPDLVMMAVKRRNPNYHNYWYVEYDVWFPSGSTILAQLDAASDADLIVPIGVARRTPQSQWFHWPTVAFPKDEDVPLAKQFHGLLCLHRASARLLDAVDSAYRRGWRGHFEAIMPTVASVEGFTIESCLALGSRIFGSPIVTQASFGALGCRPTSGTLIYHPVKHASAERALRDGQEVRKGP